MDELKVTARLGFVFFSGRNQKFWSHSRRDGAKSDVVTWAAVDRCAVGYGPEP